MVRGVGEGLLQILEGRLFEAAGYSSFQQNLAKAPAACMSPRYAKYCIAAARLIRSFPDTVQPPVIEWHIRPLLGHPIDDALAAWQLALRTATSRGCRLSGLLVEACMGHTIYWLKICKA